MPNTFPSGIFYPAGTDEANLPAILGSMANSIQLAFNAQGNARAGTSAERNAFTDDATEGTLWVDTNGIKGVYQKKGANWDQVLPVEIPVNPIKAIAAGKVFIEPTATNQTNMVPITFPAGRFTKTPIMNVTPNTAVPGRLSVSYANLTTSGCNIVMYRETIVGTTVDWEAKQID